MADRTIERLASYAARIDYDVLPARVVHQIKRLFLDSLGCGIGAFYSEPATAAREIASLSTSTKSATILGTQTKSTPELAAFANGLMVRYLDFNDSYNGADIAHPSDNIPVALAAGEAHGASGKQVIAAIALAYEVQAAWADTHQLQSNGGVWDQAAYASIAAPLGAGKVIGLTEDQLADAVRISVVSSMTLGEARRGMISHWKAAAVPNAGRNGVFAAMLAQRGMTGPPEIFSGSHGFFAGVCNGPLEMEPLAGEQGNGREYRLMESRFKQFPAGFVSQTAIEAAIEARRILNINNTSDIRCVRIKTFESGLRIMAGDPTRWHPETRETADHSIPYVVGCALKFGTLEPQHFEDDILCDTDLLELMSRIEVVRDPECDAAWPEAILNIVTVETTDGRTHTAHVPYYTGHFKKPMSDSQIEEKFRRLADGLVGKHHQDQIIELVWNLDTVTDLSALLKALSVNNG